MSLSLSQQPTPIVRWPQPLHAEDLLHAQVLGLGFPICGVCLRERAGVQGEAGLAHLWGPLFADGPQICSANSR